MRYLVIILSFINGSWMLIDGCYVLATGKYIGPEKPGPWASLVSITGVDVYKLGPLFVVYGVGWITFVASFWAYASWARSLGIALSVLTLWYLPFGTLISIIVLAVLLFFIKG